MTEQIDIKTFKGGVHQELAPIALEDNQVADWNNVIFENGEVISDFNYDEHLPAFGANTYPVKIVTMPYCNSNNNILVAFCNHIENDPGDYDANDDYGELYFYYPFITGDAWVKVTGTTLPLWYADQLLVKYYRKLQTAPANPVTYTADHEIEETLSTVVSKLLFCSEVEGALRYFTITQTGTAPVTYTAVTGLYITKSPWYIKGFILFQDRLFCWGHEYYKNKIIWSKADLFRFDTAENGTTIEFNIDGSLYRENIENIFFLTKYGTDLLVVHSKGIEKGEYIGKTNYLLRYNDVTTNELYAYTLYNNFEHKPVIPHSLLAVLPNGLAILSSTGINIYTKRKELVEIPNVFWQSFFDSRIPTAISNNRITFKRLVYHVGLKQLLILYHKYEETALDVYPSVDITQTIQEYEDEFNEDLQGEIPVGYTHKAFGPDDPTDLSTIPNAGSRERIFMDTEYATFPDLDTPAIAAYDATILPAPTIETCFTNIVNALSSLNTIWVNGTPDYNNSYFFGIVDSAIQNLYNTTQTVLENIKEEIEKLRICFDTNYQLSSFFNISLGQSRFFKHYIGFFNTYLRVFQWCLYDIVNLYKVFDAAWNPYPTSSIMSKPSGHISNSYGGNRVERSTLFLVVYSSGGYISFVPDMGIAHDVYGVSIVSRLLSLVSDLASEWGGYISSGDPLHWYCGYWHETVTVTDTEAITRKKTYTTEHQALIDAHVLDQADYQAIFDTEQEQRAQRLLNLTNENPRVGAPIEDLSLVEESGLIKYDVIRKIWYKSIFPSTLATVKDIQIVHPDLAGRVQSIESTVVKAPYPELVHLTSAGKAFRYHTFDSTLVQNSYIITKLFKKPAKVIRLSAITLVGSIIAGCYIYYRIKEIDSWALLGITTAQGTIGCNLEAEYFQLRIGAKVEADTAINFKIASLYLHYLLSELQS